MGTRDKRVDAYIAGAADFAAPILERLRAIIHEACPGVEETVKWGKPFFMYNGHIICGMSAFKAHTGLWMWTRGAQQPVSETPTPGLGQFGRITSLADLPPKKVIADAVKKTVATAESDKPAPRLRKHPPRSLTVPPGLAAALKRSRTATKNFAAFPPSGRADYIEWINAAKTDATRDKRVATALEWISDGKPHNWRYMKEYK